MPNTFSFVSLNTNHPYRTDMKVQTENQIREYTQTRRHKLPENRQLQVDCIKALHLEAEKINVTSTNKNNRSVKSDATAVQKSMLFTALNVFTIHKSGNGELTSALYGALLETNLTHINKKAMYEMMLNLSNFVNFLTYDNPDELVGLKKRPPTSFAALIKAAEVAEYKNVCELELRKETAAGFEFPGCIIKTEDITCTKTDSPTPNVYEGASDEVIMRMQKYRTEAAAKLGGKLDPNREFVSAFPLMVINLLAGPAYEQWDPQVKSSILKALLSAVKPVVEATSGLKSVLGKSISEFLNKEFATLDATQNFQALEMALNFIDGEIYADPLVKDTLVIGHSFNTIQMRPIIDSLIKLKHEAEIKAHKYAQKGLSAASNPNSLLAATGTAAAAAAPAVEPASAEFQP